jgi:hypothetical protein
MKAQGLRSFQGPRTILYLPLANNAAVCGNIFFIETGGKDSCQMEIQYFFMTLCEHS